MGRVIKNGDTNMNANMEVDAAVDMEIGRRLKAWIKGEMTWAEVEGMTWHEAKAIAEVGCDLAGAGRLEEARVIFEGLVAGNPKDSAMQSALGTVYQKLGRLEEAKAAYDAAIELDPRNPVALGNRGELRLKSGDNQGFGDLARAVESDPHGETAAGRRSKGLITAITLQAVQIVKAQGE